jgi:hypothetical protein
VAQVAEHLVCSTKSWLQTEIKITSVGIERIIRVLEDNN